MNTLNFCISILSSLIIISGCLPDLPVVPPINSTSTGESHPGKFV